jgi:hypothetical protein
MLKLTGMREKQHLNEKEERSQQTKHSTTTEEQRVQPNQWPAITGIPKQHLHIHTTKNWEMPKKQG